MSATSRAGWHDRLDAGTQGMVGYLIQQELRSLLPPENQVVTLLTMTVVDPDDPAFATPTKFVGPVYPKQRADALAAEKGWKFRQDGDAWRRVVPSPAPRRVVEIQPHWPRPPGTRHLHATSICCAGAVTSSREGDASCSSRAGRCSRRVRLRPGCDFRCSKRCRGCSLCRPIGASGLSRTSSRGSS